MITSNSIEELILFKVDTLFCGITTKMVSGINKKFNLTKVYRSPDYVRGVINLRGDIVTILDLRKILQIETVDITDETPIIVVTSNEETIGLLVDSIIDVIPVLPERLEPSLANISSNLRDYYSGVYKTDNELITILDSSKLFDIDMLQRDIQ